MTEVEEISCKSAPVTGLRMPGRVSPAANASTPRENTRFWLPYLQPANSVHRHYSLVR
jgi:hypothetical protein